MTIRSARLPLPFPAEEIDLVAGFAATNDLPSPERFYWSRPSASLSVLGLGAVAVVEASGPRRFAEASAAVRKLSSNLEVTGVEAPPQAGPIFVGGFSFADRDAQRAPWEPFPSCRWVLPEILVVRSASAAWLTISRTRDSEASPLAGAEQVFSSLRAGQRRGPSSIGPDAAAACGFERQGPEGMASGPEYRVRSDRSHADYRAQVDAARRAIASGDLEKVVLARSLRVRHEGRFDVPAVLGRLEGLYPTCATFAVSRPGGCFLGATPERLVALRGNRVLTGAVAGSAPRGRSPEEDDRLGRDLRESKKEQEEHAVVVRAITDALEPICGELSALESPRLLRIEGIQHLETPIEGTLRGHGPRLSVLDLAGRLHPTPAVGGAPTRGALDWIERFEGLDRGWYAGGVGWIDRQGGGEVRVALRSGLIRPGSGASASDEEAFLFGGGGIVADSQPEHELEETRIKLRALLAPLTDI